MLILYYLIAKLNHHLKEKKLNLTILQNLFKYK